MHIVRKEVHYGGNFQRKTERSGNKEWKKTTRKKEEVVIERER